MFNVITHTKKGEKRIISRKTSQGQHKYCLNYLSVFQGKKMAICLKAEDLCVVNGWLPDSATENTLVHHKCDMHELLQPQ